MKPIYDDDENEFSRGADSGESDAEDTSASSGSPTRTKSKRARDNHIHLVLHRRIFIAFVTLIILLALGISAWQFGWWNKFTDWYSAAEVTVNVVEMNTHLAMSGATVQIGNETSVTNTAGVVDIKHVHSGKVTIVVTKPGYLAKSYTTTLYRGLNPLSDIVIEKAPDKLYSLNVSITDAISTQGVKAAKVTIGIKVDSSNDQGIIIFQLPSDASSAHIAKDGYTSQDVPLTLQTDAFTPITVQLMPVRYVVFDQEISGKTDLYQTDFTAANPIKLTDSKGALNDHPVVSPDQKLIAFLSDRDGVLNGTTPVTRLYLLDTKGTITKTTADSSPDFVSWVNSTTVLYSFTSTPTGAALAQSGVALYHTDSGKRDVLTPSVVSGLGSVVSLLSSSADGKIVSYYLTVTNADNTPNVDLTGVYTATVSGGSIKRVSKSTKIIHDLYFSNDAKTLYYSYTDATTTVLYSIDLSSGAESDVSTKATVRERAFVQSHTNPGALTAKTTDGRYIYIDTKNGKSDVFTLLSDGKTEQQLTNLGKVASVNLSADGQYVLVGVQDGTSSSLYVVGSLAGTALKLSDSVDLFAQTTSINMIPNATP